MKFDKEKYLARKEYDKDMGIWFKLISGKEILKSEKKTAKRLIFSNWMLTQPIEPRPKWHRKVYGGG